MNFITFCIVIIYLDVTYTVILILFYENFL